MSLKKFLTKHAGELGKVTKILGTIVSLLPIDRQDKAQLRDTLGELDSAAASIAKAAKAMTDTGIKIDAKALETAVKAALPDVIEEIAKRVFDMQQNAAASGRG